MGLRVVSDDAATEHTAALEAALEHLTPDMVACRDYGHAWAPLWANWDAKARAFDTGIQCRRCATTRARLLDRSGQQIGNHYQYPDGYLMRGVGRLTGSDRDRIRLAQVAAVLNPRQRRAAGI